jgi:PncC family amidohydrolase
MLKRIIKQIHHKLLHNQKTISVAESCTGGLVCDSLTCSSGSSAYFILGLVAYSNRSKETILNIPAKIIAKYGAVSSNVAILMAENIRKKMRTDFGLSITGIAGPTGATKNKPTGTVFICLAKENKNICLKFYFRGNRLAIRKKAVYQALRLLCAHL